MFCGGDGGGTVSFITSETRRESLELFPFDWREVLRGFGGRVIALTDDFVNRPLYEGVGYRHRRKLTWSKEEFGGERDGELWVVSLLFPNCSFVVV